MDTIKYLKNFIFKSFTYKLYIFFKHKKKYHKHVIFNFSNNIIDNSIFEGMNKLYPGTTFSGYLGYGSYIGRNSFIIGKIGRYCSIGRNIKTNPGIHPYTIPFVSTSPVFYSLAKQNGGTFTTKQRFNEFRYADENNSYPIIIGHDCWIGENAFIVGGVQIGNGAVILAGAVVTKDVPPYAIVAGIPAKVIKYRYDADTISFLQSYQWWEKNPEWLKQNIEQMNNIEKLKEYAKVH